MPEAATALWSFFLAGAVSVTIVVVAFALALVIAQRQRLRMRENYAHKVLLAHEEERALVAGELHDDAIQRVTTLGQELFFLSESLGRPRPEEAHRLRVLNNEIKDLGRTLRSLARRVHPTIVDQVGLVRSLGALAEEMRGVHHLAVRIATPAEDIRLEPEVARAGYRIAQEALRNVARHAGTNEASVEVEARPGGILLRVRDRGVGFDPGAKVGDGSLGLITIRERAVGVGGSVAITTAPGEGTTVEAILPRVAAG